MEVSKLPERGKLWLVVLESLFISLSMKGIRGMISSKRDLGVMR